MKWGYVLKDGNEYLCYDSEKLNHFRKINFELWEEVRKIQVFADRLSCTLAQARYKRGVIVRIGETECS